ncbi:gp040 [Rhodococcus phage ReqiPoco6]|uniref:Gp040 n=1 Tax=Rhodococcus phage ReqiPoco6 TaxID=691964 RepID=D4P7Q8_9CAUD|nr:gp040 [Rhodococcus phage ReqiPoco6]ADD81038.1 gp040 [Rhodococcus phage ReqiPoco6]
MDALPHFVSLAVALIAALSALATQQASSKASRKEKQEASRASMETEAYERARAFDIATIDRQNEQIAALLEKVAKQDAEMTQLQEKLKMTNERLESIESHTCGPDAGLETASG